MTDAEKTVFISYRRDASKYLAAYIDKDLRQHGYDVFRDIKDVDSGAFETIILSEIAARMHFIVILAPGSLKRCDEPGDWLRREIERAMDLQRNIVPILVDDFSFSSRTTKKYLTGKLVNLSRYNALEVPYSFLDEGMDRLRERYLKLPKHPVIITPIPPDERETAQQKEDELANQPAPTEKELSAEEYFNRAYIKDDEGDYDGAIADLDEAIRLNPQYADAYNNRGIARRNKNDYDSAIADYTEAIRLNLRYAIGYNNRGVARYDKGDFDSAIADYTEAIRLKPQYADAYNNRGNARDEKGDYEGAIADYNEAIRLNPDYVEAYVNRGNARYDKGDFDSAIADYTEAIRLKPQYADAYIWRAETYFATQHHDLALSDFQQANNLKPAYKFALGGLAITHHALGHIDEAKRLWKTLVVQDERYKDADWVGKELKWAAPLVEEARKLIAKL